MQSVRRGLALAMRPRAPLAVLTRAGGAYRTSIGEDRSNNATGPLHDLADFHFADGTAAPVTATQMMWKRERSAEAERINRLGQEMWDLHLRGAELDDAMAKQQEEAAKLEAEQQQKKNRKTKA